MFTLKENVDNRFLEENKNTCANLHRQQNQGKLNILNLATSILFSSVTHTRDVRCLSIAFVNKKGKGNEKKIKFFEKEKCTFGLTPK